ncbi:MAG TPA: MinD/ParA family protein [Nautiliaceae bacterium]|nr:MinD/ParA family protein [Nautiliaceae bacterium]
MVAKVISVTSTKGGVGKTFLTVNLGAALKYYFNKEVLIIDANISAPNLALNLGIVNPSISFQDVINNKNKEIRLGDSIEKTKYIDLIASRIGQEVSNKNYNLKEELTELKKIYDFILLDTSPNMNWETKMALDASDTVILVSNPDTFSISNLISLIKNLEKENYNIEGIVLNRVLGKDFEIKSHEVEELTKINVLQEIPFSVKVFESLAFTEPIVYYKPYSKVSRSIRSLAEKISGERYKSSLTEKILEFLFGW